MRRGFRRPHARVSSPPSCVQSPGDRYPTHGAWHGGVGDMVMLAHRRPTRDEGPTQQTHVPSVGN